MARKAATSLTEQGNKQEVRRRVKVAGMLPIMFDRYPGDNDTKLDPWQKVYLMPDGETLCLPALNIISFLSAENTTSAPKILLDKRKYKDVCRACRNYVTIEEQLVPFTRNGAPIRMGRPDGDQDELSGLTIHRCVARLEKGIPNPKVRPTLPCPWELEFNLRLLPNDVLQETMLHWLIVKGGESLGWGTFRGSYGKFRVEVWE